MQSLLLLQTVEHCSHSHARTLAVTSFEPGTVTTSTTGKVAFETHAVSFALMKTRKDLQHHIRLLYIVLECFI